MSPKFFFGLMLIVGGYAAEQSTPSSAERAVEVQVEKWTEKARNFVNSVRTPLRAEQHSALIEVLAEGNVLIESMLRVSDGVRGVGEDFGEVNAVLVDMLWHSGNRQDPKVLDVLATGAYNPSSPFAREIAKEYGDHIVPTILQKRQSDVFVIRATATQMLGTILLENSKLQPSVQDAIHRAIITAAADEQVAVRIAAVTTLGRVGTATDLTVLQRIATDDPVSVKEQRGIQYPVREAAQKAISEIQRR
jgi:hypothetical protein